MNSNFVSTRCYCITSKYPFYKLHYQILRIIVEIIAASDKRLRMIRHKRKQKHENSIEVDVVVEKHGPLGLRLRRTMSHPQQNLPISKTDKQHELSMQYIACNYASASSTICQVSEDICTHAAQKAKSENINPTRPYESTANYAVTVDGFDADDDASILAQDWQKNIRVGDTLVAINGHFTDQVQFIEVVDMIRRSDRPLRLRFARALLGEGRLAKNLPSLKSLEKRERQNATLKIQEVIFAFQTMNIKRAGEYSDVRIGSRTFRYTFPQRDAERWTCVVAFRMLSPYHIMSILCCLLLEKQVVVQGTNIASVAAITTAFLLMLSPYKWQSTFVPILPSTMLDVLHSPVPFLVGTSLTACSMEWDDVYILNIDDDIIRPPYTTERIDATCFPNINKTCQVMTSIFSELRSMCDPNRPWHDPSDFELTAASGVLHMLKCRMADIPKQSLVHGSTVSTENFSKRFAATLMYSQHPKTN